MPDDDDTHVVTRRPDRTSAPTALPAAEPLANDLSEATGPSLEQARLLEVAGPYTPRAPSRLSERDCRWIGALVGAAVGDALVLPWRRSSLRPRASAERDFGDAPHYALLAEVGLFSAETETLALLLHTILEQRQSFDALVRQLRRRLGRWILSLPAGATPATRAAAWRMLFGQRQPGRPAADNGVALRALALALAWPHDAKRRVAHGRALARLTHTDPRAVEGALFASELTARCLGADTQADRRQLVGRALESVQHATLRQAITEAASRTHGPKPRSASAYIVDTLRVCVADFVQRGDAPEHCLSANIGRAATTPVTTALLGGWLGALHGHTGLPAELVQTLDNGPLGRDHLVSLALAAARGTSPPRSLGAWRGLSRHIWLHMLIWTRRLRPRRGAS